MVSDFRRKVMGKLGQRGNLSRKLDNFGGLMMNFVAEPQSHLQVKCYELRLQMRLGCLVLTPVFG